MQEEEYHDTVAEQTMQEEEDHDTVAEQITQVEESHFTGTEHTIEKEVFDLIEEAEVVDDQDETNGDQDNQDTDDRNEVEFTPANLDVSGFGPIPIPVTKKQELRAKRIEKIKMEVSSGGVSGKFQHPIKFTMI